jgi:putative oxidoreductase
MKIKTIIDIISFLLIMLFVYTGASKLLEHDRFVFQLRLSPLPLITTMALFLSWTIPFLELIISTALVIGLFNPYLLKKGLWASLVLIASFEIYITAILFSGKNLPCACGGIISLMSWKGHELFNGLTITLIGVGLINFKSYISNIDAHKRYSRV